MMPDDNRHAGTPQSAYLLRLGRRVLAPYTRLPATRAAMITGSAAEGIADFHSDLDTTIYYDGDLPDEDTLAAIRVGNGAPERAWLIGDRGEGAVAEAYELDGIQVQIGHVTIAAWEEQMAEVLERFNPDTPLHKAMSGTLDSIAVHGGDLMEQWKERIAAYPEGLRKAMVTRHLQFFPVWSMPHLAVGRDAMLWHAQARLEAAFNILGVLAGLNRQYFTTFQFKKMRRFLAPMSLVPEKCPDRLEAVMASPPDDAAQRLEGLIGEVVALVEEALPDVDVTAVRRRLGTRRPEWRYVG